MEYWQDRYQNAVISFYKYGRALSNYEYRYRRRKNYGSLSLWKCLVLEHIASTRSNESLTRYNLPGCIGRTILAGSAGVVVADTDR